MRIVTCLKYHDMYRDRNSVSLHSQYLDRDGKYQYLKKKNNCEISDFWCNDKQVYTDVGTLYQKYSFKKINVFEMVLFMF